MIKTLNNIFKQDKEKFVVPKGVQDCIPVMVIYDDGIFVHLLNHWFPDHLRRHCIYNGAGTIDFLWSIGKME